jgi:hypothetical protein
MTTEEYIFVTTYREYGNIIFRLGQSTKENLVAASS